MATNRADTLDPALLRPGRLDRKIEFPLPDRRQKRLVFQACTAKMNLHEEVYAPRIVIVIILRWLYFSFLCHDHLFNFIVGDCPIYDDKSSSRLI